MGIPDSFDPLMFLSKTDDTVAGSYDAPGKSSESARPSVIEYKGDGTAQLRSAANTKHNSEVPASGTENGKPSVMFSFNPLAVNPGTKPGLAGGHSKQAKQGHGG